MKVNKTELPGVLLIEPSVFHDPRGFFLELWQQQRYQEAGLPSGFVQDNLSHSIRGTLRGLHFQHPHGQGKLVYVLQGEIFDVAVDIRLGSPTFGRWLGVVLTDQAGHQVYVPEGFAHGFCVLSESALVGYKCTNFYNAQTEGGVLWNDPALAIAWPTTTPLLSHKDQHYPPLQQIPREQLPQFLPRE